MLRDGLIDLLRKPYTNELSDEDFRIYFDLLREPILGTLAETRENWEAGLIAFVEGEDSACARLGISSDKLRRTIFTLQEAGWIEVSGKQIIFGHLVKGTPRLLCLSKAEESAAPEILTPAAPSHVPDGLEGLWSSVYRQKQSESLAEAARLSRTAKTPRYSKKDASPATAVINRFVHRYQGVYGEPPEWYDYGKIGKKEASLAANSLKYARELSKDPLNTVLAIVDFLFDNEVDFKSRLNLDSTVRLDLWCIATKEHFARLNTWKSYDIWQTSKREATKAIADREQKGKQCKEKALQKPPGSFL